MTPFRVSSLAYNCPSCTSVRPPVTAELPSRLLLASSDATSFMTQYDPARIDLGPDEGLPDLLTRVRATRGDEVTVSFDEHSNLLLTASEFRQLRSTADQVRVDVILETSDPLRIQLASMFGFGHTNRPRQDMVEDEVEHPNWPMQPDRVNVSRSQVPVGTVATSKPWREEAVDASIGLAVPPKPVPRPEFALEPRTGSIQHQASDARARMRTSSIIGAVAAIVALVCVAAVLSIVLRTGEVVVRTQRQTISTSLVVGYSTDGSQIAGSTVTLPAEQTQFTVPYVTTASATGVLDSASGKATGTIDLRNISGRRVTVPAGTQLTAADGQIFVTTADAVVASGDAEEPGTGQAIVTAAASGTAGNMALGTFTGPVPDVDGVFFANISGAFTGGSDVVAHVVTDADIQTATTSAQQQLDQMATTWQLPDGRVVIPSTVQPSGTASIEANHAAGEQADSFEISAQGSYTALTVDPNNLPENLQDQLRSTLLGLVPANYRLTDEPVRFANPTEAQPGTGLIEVDVSIDAAAILDQNTIDDIKRAAAGQSLADAKTAVANIPNVTVEDVSVQPSLIIRSMPSEGKIDVVEK